MQKQKLEKVMKYVTTLRNKKVALDYDLATVVELSIEEIDAVMEKNLEKFRNHDVIELTDAEREELLKDERFASLPEKPKLRWAFTVLGMTLFIMQLDDSDSVRFTHNVIETYIDVISLRGVMIMLANDNIPEGKERDIIMQDCNRLMNKVLSGEDPDYNIKIRSATAVAGRRPEESAIPPFSHPENRYDPITKRFWFSEEEVNIIQNALGDSLPEFSKIKREACE